MRVLVAFAGGRGHLLPLLPLAAALRAAGHVLALSGGHRAVAGADALGLFERVLPHDRMGRPAPPPPDGGTGALDVPGLEHELEVIGRSFAGSGGQRNRQRTRRVLERWPADLVVCDEMDFGTVAAAREAGLPCVVVDVIATGALTRSPYVDEPLDALGLDLATARGDLEVCPFPRSLRDPVHGLRTSAAHCRPAAADDPSGPRPAVAWLTEHGGPSVYLTLGTVFNTESGDLFARLLGALGGGEARVLATVGDEVDRDRLGSFGPQVRIEGFVPQAAVLPHVDAVVNHGGSGSVVGALAHGRPVVTVPMGADQALNAERLVALGAGLRLDPLAAAGDVVRAAVGAALHDPGLRSAAGAVADEVAALPDASTLVPRLEALAAVSR